MEFANEKDFNKQWKAGKVQVGAVWEAHWEKGCRKGPDGQSLVILTPAGCWYIDERSSTCTRKDDHEHRCWIRHGSAEEGNLQVDKKGDTCESGAGSVRIINKKNGQSSYHARLMQGQLIRIIFF